MYLHALSWSTNLVQASMTEAERIAHYRDLAAQFRQWAETETNEEARAGLLDMAQQYERLAGDRPARSPPFDR
jgi:hypothetical protein